MFEKEIRILIEQMKPRPKTSLFRNKRMERRFNKEYGVLSRKFSVGQTMVTRDFYGVKPTWKIGTIIRIKGKVIYEVEIGEKI